jgi:3-oxoacyl-[acyl-carrier protein] reductase
MSARKTLVVTGASRGLGRHIAAAAQDAGYKVVGLARSASQTERFDIRACDIRNDARVRETFKALRGEESLYGLINAAGVASMNLVVSTPPETMRQIVEVNLLGTMYCCAAIGKLLARRKTGRIINFSTIAVPLALKGEAAYIASKAGVEAFSRAFAREMADFDVTVNTVAPGPIRTDLIKHIPDIQINRVVSAQVLPRMGTPDDVWDIVSFLLSDQARMTSGQVFKIGGV